MKEMDYNQLLMLDTCKYHNDSYIFVDGKRNFIVFNASLKMTFEEVTDKDIFFIKRPVGNFNSIRSAVWSSNVNWFFLLRNDGIYLMNIWSDDIIWCKKRSFKFVDYFGKAPVPKKQKKIKSLKIY